MLYRLTQCTVIDVPLYSNYNDDLCKLYLVLITFSVSPTALWSSDRHLALGSEGPGLDSWLCQVDVESLGKALYMHLLTSLICKMRTLL